MATRGGLRLAVSNPPFLVLFAIEGSRDRACHGGSGALTQNLKGNGLINGQGVVVGPNGNLLVVNESGNNVLQYNATTGAYLGVFGTTSTSSRPIEIGPDGNVDVGGDNMVERFDGMTSAYLGIFASGNGLNSVSGLAFDAAGNTYAGNAVSGGVRKFSSSGAFISNFTSGQPTRAGAIIFNGTHLLVANTFGNGGPSWGNQILEFDANGTLLGDFASGAMLDGPNGMKFGPDGYLYVVNYIAGSVVRFTSTGTFVDTFLPSSPSAFRDIAFVGDAAAPSTGVPEPTSLALAGAGLFAVVALRSRKRS